MKRAVKQASKLRDSRDTSRTAVRDLLLSFITRLNENEPEGTSNAAGCYRERDTDATAVRRSWQAMMIFTTGATPLVDLLSSSDVYTFRTHREPERARVTL